MNYYPRHIGDYLKDTAHLSLLEHGVYSRLLDVYYSTEGPIDAQQVFRLIGARSKDEMAAATSVLGEFFEHSDGWFAHARCDRELAAMQDKQSKARASAAKRWDKKPSNANALLEPCEGNAPNTNTNTKEEKTARKRAASPVVDCPEGVDAQVWADWLALRKAKRAPVTATTIAGATAEAAKAGMSLDAFLRVWCRRGSQGLEADWLKPNERGSPVGVTVPVNPQVGATREYLARQAEHAANAKAPPPEVLAKLRGLIKVAA